MSKEELLQDTLETIDAELTQIAETDLYHVTEALKDLTFSLADLHEHVKRILAISKYYE